jgi:hypothetical protein
MGITPTSLHPLTGAESRRIRQAPGSGSDQVEALGELLHFLDTTISRFGADRISGISSLLFQGMPNYLRIHAENGSETSIEAIKSSFKGTGLSDKELGFLAGHLDALIKLLPENSTVDHPAIQLLQERFSHVMKQVPSAEPVEASIISKANLEEAASHPSVEAAIKELVTASLVLAEQGASSTVLKNLAEAAVLEDTHTLSSEALADELKSFSAFITDESNRQAEINSEFLKLNPISQNFIKDQIQSNLERIEALDLAAFLAPFISKNLAQNPTLEAALRDLVPVEGQRPSIEGLKGKAFDDEIDRRAALAGGFASVLGKISSLMLDRDINPKSLIEAEIAKFKSGFEHPIYAEDMEDIRASVAEAKEGTQAAKQGMLAGLLGGVLGSGTTGKWMRAYLQNFATDFLGKILYSTLGKLPGGKLILGPIMGLIQAKIAAELQERHIHRNLDRAREVTSHARRPRRPIEGKNLTQAQAQAQVA